MSDKEFKNRVSGIKKTRNKYDRKDGHITVYSKQFEYKNIPYIIKIRRYYRIGLKLKKIQGYNRICKYVVLEYPKSIKDFINKMEKKYDMVNASNVVYNFGYNFLSANTKHIGQEYWTLRRMVIRMHTQAKEDINKLLYYKNLNLNWKTFKINKFIELRFIDGKTLIYVNNKKFDHCKYLLLNIPVDKITDYDNIDSIDDISEILDKSMEHQNFREHQIPPETEFWGHCSNLQVWSECNYDTRLVHRNLAFPLLRKLTDVGDPTAKKVFKEEIAKRLESDNINVVKYLVNGEYIDYLTKDELNSLSLSKKCKDIILRYQKDNDEINALKERLYMLEITWRDIFYDYEHPSEIDFNRFTFPFSYQFPQTPSYDPEEISMELYEIKKMERRDNYFFIISLITIFILMIIFLLI